MHSGGQSSNTANSNEGSNRQASLWMGDVESYMDEAFITNAFKSMGETIQCVKMINNKFSGNRPSYCFVHCTDEATAQRMMLKLNGKVIPESNPVKRFKLNHASYGRGHLLSPEYSLFVGDLSNDVDDFKLYTAFAAKYKSTITAKVVLDQSGNSRGYGFVRFSSETDQKKALDEMKGVMIGFNPIRISMATQKRSMRNTQDGSQNPDYNNWSQQQQQQYGGWGGMPYPGYDPSSGMGQYYPPPTGGWGNYAPGQDQYPNYQDPNQQQNWAQYNQFNSQNTKETNKAEDTDDDGSTQDPLDEMDIDQMNKDFIERSEELYMALEGSRWHPLDNIMSTITSSNRGDISSSS